VADVRTLRIHAGRGRFTTRWRKALQDKTSSRPVVRVASAKGEASSSHFMPVQVVRPARTEVGLVEVVTRGGCVVRVHGAVDEVTLASVFSAVGAC
jgi:hypothetical protein